MYLIFKNIQWDPMSFKKNCFVYIFIPFLRITAPLFFDKNYLHGKYFDNSEIGWKWVLRSLLWQKIFGINRRVPWPVSPFISISNPDNIYFEVDDMNNFQTHGIYFQNFKASIYIGKGVYIAPNVGIITTNHNPLNLDEHLEGKDIIIGDNCWIGMNSVILPGVKLGKNTIVGAGAIVTKSYPQGNIILAGNPAKIIREIDITK